MDLTINCAIIFLSIISIVLLCAIIYYLYYKANVIKITCDQKKLSHITRLMPWIYAQLSKSVEVVLNNYKLDVQRNIIKRDISQDTYLTIINDIRVHFYGTIPKSLSLMLFKYIDKKQIDILLLAEFRLQNQSYFTITNNSNDNE